MQSTTVTHLPKQPVQQNQTVSKQTYFVKADKQFVKFMTPEGVEKTYEVVYKKNGVKIDLSEQKQAALAEKVVDLFSTKLNSKDKTKITDLSLYVITKEAISYKGQDKEQRKIKDLPLEDKDFSAIETILKTFKEPVKPKPTGEEISVKEKGLENKEIAKKAQSLEDKEITKKDKKNTKPEELSFFGKIAAFFKSIFCCCCPAKTEENPVDEEEINDLGENSEFEDTVDEELPKHLVDDKAIQKEQATKDIVKTEVAKKEDTKTPETSKPVITEVKAEVKPVQQVPATTIETKPVLETPKEQPKVETKAPEVVPVPQATVATEPKPVEKNEEKK